MKVHFCGVFGPFQSMVFWCTEHNHEPAEMAEPVVRLFVGWADMSGFFGCTVVLTGKYDRTILAW